MIKHCMQHINIKPYECEKCDFHSKSSSGLSMHQRVHAQNVPLQCKYCEDVTLFKNIHTLSLHYHKDHLWEQIGEEGVEIYFCN